MSIEFKWGVAWLVIAGLCALYGFPVACVIALIIGGFPLCLDL